MGVDIGDFVSYGFCQALDVLHVTFSDLFAKSYFRLNLTTPEKECNRKSEKNLNQDFFLTHEG